MVSADKIVIYQGDTFKVQYESMEPDPLDANDYNFTKAPYDPDSATVQVWDIETQDFLPIGGSGVYEDAADVLNNVITYILDGSFTEKSGSYKMFVTAVYPDGQRVTEIQPFKVSPKG